MNNDWPHRTYCEVLEDMRNNIKTCTKYTLDNSLNILSSLIEELQVYGSRMEAGLSYKRDLFELHNKRKELRAKVRALEKKLPKEEDDS